MLKEGPDFNTLGGGDATPSSSPYSNNFMPTQPPRSSKAGQPAASTTVPPTPSSSGGQHLSRTRSPSTSSSSDDRFFDAEDGDLQTKRRSMFRSPGSATASSPDLATLVKKAKEKNRAMQGQPRPGNQQSVPPGPSTAGLSPGSLPQGSDSSRTRPRAFTNVQAQDRPLSPSKSQTKKGKLFKNQRGVDMDQDDRPSSAMASEWVMPSSRSQSEINANKGKSSVRSKTSAFLGKIMGQGTLREKMRDFSSSSTPNTPTHKHTAPPLFSAFPPPVPPIPNQHRSPPPAPLVGDAFSNGVGAPDMSKPLPSIELSEPPGPNGDDSDDDKSLVMVESSSSPVRRRARSPSPEKTIKSRQSHDVATFSPRQARRRSMSVGEAELRTAMIAAASTTPMPGSSTVDDSQAPQRKEWDTNLNGIMKDFRGELSQLDPISTSTLDLKDPSVPKSDGFSPSRGSNGGTSTTPSSPPPGRLNHRPKLRMHTSSPTRSSTPSVVVNAASASDSGHQVGNSQSPSQESLAEEPFVPLRSSSLQTPGKVSNIGTARPSGVRYGPRLARPSSITALNGTPSTRSQPSSSVRDAMRLRVHHRSTASSSEPSLIPTREGDRSGEPNRTVRLVPSTPSMGRSEATSPVLSIYSGSQNDLTSDDLAVTRFPSAGPKTEETGEVDIDKRGKDLAQRCWTEDEEFLAKEKIAEWLGGTGRINKVALHYYMTFFDFTGLRLDVAFRRLCAKLYLKAETQQVDRILEEFSGRYWETNTGTVYGSASVVHAVAYSLLLLNTDLHVAELSQRMSRTQFVRNTLAAIQSQIRPTTGIGRASTPDLTHDDGSSIRGVGSDGSDTGGSTLRSRPKRSGSVNSWNSVTRDLLSSPNTPGVPFNSSTTQVPVNGSSTSVHEPRIRNPSATSVVYGRNFDSDMESLLKEMYAAIKSQQILQPLGHLNMTERASVSSLSPGGTHALMRNRSQRNDRLTNLKRGSMRGIQTLFTAQSGASPYSSNSSIDGRISPSPSFATSAYETMTGSSSSFLTPTLGFASNLSHTIIREAQEDDDRSVHSNVSDSTNVSISDEELALLGAPWAKEGMLCRKQYLESVGRRAKSKNWLDVFVVIQKGELSMFTFGETELHGAREVGGGNWLSNANQVGNFTLAHSLAHALPPPGYNRQRPYCFVLTLASGGQYFFQAGTEELVNEWISTCNYWAARQSKEPLAGGVSNMEYGWNRVLDSAEDDRASSSQDGRTSKDPDPSDAYSTRSGRSKMSRKDGPFTMRLASSPYAERISIHDWKSPMPSTVPSNHDEESQLEALQKHASTLKKDIKTHNNLRTPMMQLYQPRSSYANKALANWERKSQYLLAEIVKYESYVESLKLAMELRLKKRGDKALEKALVVASPEDGSPPRGRWKGYPEEDTIPEGDEPPPTPGFQVHHRRGSAEAVDD